MGTIFTLPNLLTSLRILAAFLIFWILTDADGELYLLILAFILCALAALSDGLDGFLARRLKQESALGKFLDPLADKLLIYLVLIPLIYVYELIPIWLFIIIGIRDISIFILAQLLTLSGKKFNVTYFAKWKTTFQDIFILSGILIVILEFQNGIIMMLWNIAVYVIALLTLLTLVHYIWINRSNLKEII